MKTFMKWLEKCEYKHTVRFNSIYGLQVEFEGCIVNMVKGRRGGIIRVPNNQPYKGDNVKELIEMIEFLVGGKC